MATLRSGIAIGSDSADFDSVAAERLPTTRAMNTSAATRTDMGTEEASVWSEVSDSGADVRPQAGITMRN